MKRQGWTGLLLFMQVGISNDIIAKWKTRAKDEEFVELLTDLMLKNLIGIIWHDISWNWQRKWLSPLIDLIRKISTLEFPVIIMLLFIQSICLGRHFCIISCRLLGSTRAMWFTLITKSSAKLVSEELVIIRQNNDCGHGWKETTFQANRSHDKTHRHSNKTVDGVRLIGL